VSFASITLCVASQRVFISLSTQSGNFWIHPRSFLSVNLFHPFSEERIVHFHSQTHHNISKALLDCRWLQGNVVTSVHKSEYYQLLFVTRFRLVALSLLLLFKCEANREYEIPSPVFSVTWVSIRLR
jgi:hypothetical protein